VSELALFLIRIGFVAVLWVFILSLLSVIRADLYGRRVISRIAKQNAPGLTAGSAASLGIDDGEGFAPTEIAVLPVAPPEPTFFSRAKRSINWSCSEFGHGHQR